MYPPVHIMSIFKKFNIIYGLGQNKDYKYDKIILTKKQKSNIIKL